MALVEAVVQRARDAAARGDWQAGLRPAHGGGRGRPRWPRRSAGARRGRLRGRPSRCDHRGVGARPRRVPAGRRPGRGSRRGGSRRDAPALRHRPDGAGARLAGTSGAAARRSGRDAGARVVGGRPHLRADADRRPARRPAVGPACRSRWVRGATRRRAPSDGWPRPGCSSWTAMSSKVWRCSTRPGWRPSPGTSIRSRPASSTASSCAPCRASPSTTWPRSGPRRWSGGARRTPSGASTGAAGSTAPRSSGCAGRATRRRVRRSWPARSCARTCDASSGGR